MENKTKSWRNRSPGDLSIHLNETSATSVQPAVEAAANAARDWARVPLRERKELLCSARAQIEKVQEELAQGISLEMGKPIREARLELGAVLAKFELTFQDVEKYLVDSPVTDNPHPALIRQRPRGPAAVIGPFNFPIHLANGAIIPHLMAGNPVVFKPSPLASNVAAHYAQIMQKSFPPGVFNFIQGGAEEGWTLCTHPTIRSISFTGSVPVGKKLAAAMAEDFSKELALELGGKNAALICEDADLEIAAQAVAEGLCLTAGQRCNSTSRVIVNRKVVRKFTELLQAELTKFVPGDPLHPETRLGPVVNEAAVKRYQHFLTEKTGTWIQSGQVLDTVQGKRGYYVTPAVILWENPDDALQSSLFFEEVFAPVLCIIVVDQDETAISLANSSQFGLTASIFTHSELRFLKILDEVHAGNVYANLPTTFSPSTLPFGGWKDSGNRRPGGRGFVRFVTNEQGVQMGKDLFTKQQE